MSYNIKINTQVAFYPFPLLRYPPYHVDIAHPSSSLRITSVYILTWHPAFKPSMKSRKVSILLLNSRSTSRLLSSLPCPSKTWRPGTIHIARSVALLVYVSMMSPSCSKYFSGSALGSNISSPSLLPALLTLAHAQRRRTWRPPPRQPRSTGEPRLLVSRGCPSGLQVRFCRAWSRGYGQKLEASSVFFVDANCLVFIFSQNKIL